eukprot:736944_1
MAERKKKKTPNSAPYAQIENVPSANIYDESIQGDGGTPSIGSQPTTPLHHTYNNTGTTITTKIPKLKIQGYNPAVQIYSSSPQDATPSPMWTPQDATTPDMHTYAQQQQQYERLPSAKSHSKQVSFKLPVKIPPNKMDKVK